MKIIIITPGFKYQNSISLLTPLFVWKNKILDIGLNFNISNCISNNLEGDVVLVDSKFHRYDWINNDNKIYEDFNFLRQRFSKVIYCDTADSSGWIQSELFPYIDKYWKLQILKDKKKYLRKMYDRRIYTNYYHERFNISDEYIDFSDANLTSLDLNKIEVFWNSSMADFSKYSHFYRKLYKFIKFNYLIKFKDNKFKINYQKTNDIFTRFNFENYRETIKFHRKTIFNKLNKLKKINNKRIGRKNYLSELAKSKISVSPFGWGEIAYRDFETFLYKSILLKPSMSHISTWPKLYQENKTYIPFDWDLSDLNDKIEYILSNYKDLTNIAVNGFDNYRKFTYDKGADSLFVNRLSHLFKNI